MTGVLVVLLLAANAFFVACEFAYVGARRVELEGKAEDGDVKAQRALGVMRELSMVLAAAQLGITVASVALGAVAEPAIAHVLEPIFEDLSVPEALVHPIAIGIALLIVTALHMVLGEMVPKNLTLAGPAAAARWLARPVLIYTRVTRPVVSVLNGLANAVLALFGMHVVDEAKSIYTADELDDVVSHSADEGVFDEGQRLRLGAALRLDETRIGDVATPWEDVVTLPRGVTQGQLRDALRETDLTRFPVVGIRPGQVLGFLHVKDLLQVPDDPDRPLPAALLHAVTTLRPDSTLGEALTLMRQSGTHLAVTRDARGRLRGVVTLDDVIGALLVATG